MSLSTLLEAAKYLDYLDSNPQGQQSDQQASQHDQSIDLHLQQTQSNQFQKTQSTSARRATRRARSSKKDAANTMIAMSLPAATGSMQLQHGVPIPLASGSTMHGHHASLSSSFTTESPLSSFASTALLCSKASEVTSASSSAASSMSSSDSSSSCGEILMGENDLNQSTGTPLSTSSIKAARASGQSMTHQKINMNNIRTDDHQMQSLTNDQATMMHKFSPNSYNDRGQSFARYIAATSSGPQLVTMTTTSSGGITSASAPIEGRLRAGHVIHAATQNANSGSGFEPQFSIGGLHGRDVQTFARANSVNGEALLSSSPGTCPPMIMARVQPMILNSISPSAHQNLLAFQSTHAIASSPTSSSSSYSRHRELHKTLEKNRRAHLRHCFELLKSELPSSECADKKTSHINIIKSAIRYVLALRQQEFEIDNELQRLTRIKNELTEKLSIMRKSGDHPDISNHIFKLENKIREQAAFSPIPSNGRPAMKNTMLPASPPTDNSSPHAMKQEGSPQQPAAEQQLSLLLSQSKID